MQNAPVDKKYADAGMNIKKWLIYGMRGRIAKMSCHL